MTDCVIPELQSKDHEMSVSDQSENIGSQEELGLGTQDFGVDFNKNVDGALKKSVSPTYEKHSDFDMSLSDEVKNIWPGIEEDNYRNDIDSHVMNRNRKSAHVRKQDEDNGENSEISSAQVKNNVLREDNVSKELEKKMMQRFIEREKQKYHGEMLPKYIQDLEKIVYQSHSQSDNCGVIDVDVDLAKEPDSIPSQEHLQSNDQETEQIAEIKPEICIQPTVNDNKDFRSHLEETTRHILRQASQNKMNAAPLRPVQQRVNIGLAQPLRRGQTSNEPRRRGQLSSGLGKNYYYFSHFE